MSLPIECAEEFITSAAQVFASSKASADKAIVQVDDERLRTSLDPETNSIAVIMKHVSGNLISRWTDFLTTDGEKPWRERDNEFVDAFENRQEILDYWDRGWSCLNEALEALMPEDLQKTVEIRGQPHSVPLAIQRSLAHTAYHCGQIIMIARIVAGDKWDTITIPRGGSAAMNERVWGKKHFGS